MSLDLIKVHQQMVTIAKKVAPKDPEEKEQKNLIKFIDYLFEKEICHVVAFERFENYITELYLNEYNIDKNVIDASINLKRFYMAILYPYEKQ